MGCRPPDSLNRFKAATSPTTPRAARTEPTFLDFLDGVLRQAGDLADYAAVVDGGQ